MTAADPTSEAGYQRPLVDVPCTGDLLRSWPVLIAMCGGALAAIVLVIVVRARGSSNSEMFLATSLLLAAAFAGWLGYQGVQQRAARRLRRQLADCSGGPIQSRIADVLPILTSAHARSLTRELAKVLVAEERFETTVRIAPTGHLPPITPIAVPFEPRPLNHIGHVGRSMLLRGGWLPLVACVCAWASSALGAYASRRITLSLMAWTILLLALALVPRGVSQLSSKQWFTVPGGLVLRRSSWRRQSWNVHLFDRHAAVLIVCRLHPRQWMAIVADRDACTSLIGRKSDLESVLQAWLSPLRPPSTEQLSDLS